MDKHIIPECYIDTNLVETLVPTKFGYHHQKSCSKVTKTMLEHSVLKNGFALGIIDEDKKTLNYIQEFNLVCDKQQLKLLKHPIKNHYIILIIPAIEKWIINNANEVGVSLTDYDLPHDFILLQKKTKVTTSNKDVNFKNLFRAIKNLNASGFVILEKWIKYLIQHPFDADLKYFNKD